MKKFKVPSWVFGVSIVCYFMTSFTLYVVGSRTFEITPLIVVVGIIHVVAIAAAFLSWGLRK